MVAWEREARGRSTISFRLQATAHISLTIGLQPALTATPKKQICCPGISTLTDSGRVIVTPAITFDATIIQGKHELIGK